MFAAKICWTDLAIAIVFVFMAYDSIHSRSDFVNTCRRQHGTYLTKQKYKAKFL